jgi:hypothetical protein
MTQETQIYANRDEKMPRPQHGHGMTEVGSVVMARAPLWCHGMGWLCRRAIISADKAICEP